MINKYTNKQRGLLAVIMAMVMVFAGAAFVAAEVDAGNAGTESVVTEKDVTTEAEFNEIFTDSSNSAITTINIKNNIEVETGLTINRSITVIGGNYTISGSVNKLITITSGDVTFSNISVTSTAAPNGSTWNAAITMGSTGKLTLNDVTVTSDCYGILINNGSLTATNLDATAWGAIYAVGQNVGDITITGTSELNGINELSDKSNSFGALVLQSTRNTTTLTNTTINATDVIVNDAYSWGISITAKAGESNTSTVILDGVSVNTGNSLALLNANPGDSTQSKMIIKNDVSVEGIIYYAGTIELDNDATLEVKCVEATVQGTDYKGVTSKLKTADGTTADVDALYKTDETITFKNGSLVIEGSVESGTITVVSGTYEVSSNIAYNVTVNAGASIRITDNIEVTGTVNVLGDIIVSDEKVVTNKGTMTVPAGTDVSQIVIDGSGALSTSTSSSDSFGMSKDLESDYTVKTSAFLEKDLTIPEGVTLTVAGTLDLNGCNLIVKGTLVVEKKGAIIGYLKTIPSEAKGIVLSKTGSIMNDGTIGKDSKVVITDGTSATVTMSNVAGLSFGLTKEIVDKVVGYTLTVSGEAVKTGEGYYLDIEGAYITDLEVKDLAAKYADDGSLENCFVHIDAVVLKNGSLIIGSKTDAVVDVVLRNGSTLTVDGTIITSFNVCGDNKTSKVEMWNSSIATINGNVDNVPFSAKADKYLTYDSDGVKNDIEKMTGIKESTITLDGIKDVVIEVTSKTYTNDAKKSETEQMLNIYGTPSDVNKIVNDEMIITIENDVYVPAGKELVLGEKMTVEQDTAGVFITEGVLSMVNGNTGFYKGSNYAVEIPKEPTGKDIINYYTTFDDAYANIATAVDMKITVQGGYTFSKEYIIAADQTIDLIDDDTKEYGISKDGKVTVEADGTILPTNSFDEIKGLLIVMDGASCKPATTAYEVSSKDTDGNMTYTSAERAIADAQPGETISITGSVEFSEDAVIPEGVTVEVASTASITAEKDLDVAGKLVNEGTITVKGDLDVSGEVDNDNSITLEAPTDGSVGDVTVTGTFVGAVSPNTIDVNAAQFTNDDGENTYTNVAAALAAVAEMDVPVDVTLTGEFSESSDVTLVEGMKLIINGEITLDSIRLVAGSQLLVENDATLTADIVAAVGTEETTGAISDAVVDVSKYEGAATDGSTWTVVYDESKATYTMKMPVYGSGAVVVEAGSVNYTGGDMPTFIATVDALTTLKIASGATIVFEESVTIEDVSQKAFINEGTVESKKGITFTGALVGGEIVVASGKVLTLQSKVGSNNVDPAVLAGNVTLKEYKGTVATVTINGLVYIGTAPETLGATGSVVGEIKLQDISGSPNVEGQVIVFEGSTFQDTTENSALESTAYSVNGIALATVYVANEVDIANDDIKKIVSKLKDVKAPGTITWYADETEVTDEDIGYYPAVDAKVPYKTVDVIVSVGPGMLVYIDDLDYSTYTDAEETGPGKDITIGTHTVTVYLQKGYEGTPAITFNGQTITDGKLVLTSDMLGKENKLVVTGATVMQDQPVVIQPSDSEKDGMELTDILLIVLVVLIVIMAIIVALRMMRS